MIVVPFAEPRFQMKMVEGKRFVFDPVRKAWLHLTEEEWVRQLFIQYLRDELNYPLAFFAVEKEIAFNGLSKRFDLVIYDRTHNPWMMIECKAPQVSLSEDTLRQLLLYNASLPVRFLVITNGHDTKGWRKEHSALKQIDTLPIWRDLNS